jgi:ABC-2 type transport system permease protein
MARKESLHIVRDPRSLLMALALPVFMILLFGYALTLDVDRIPTLVYDQDRSPLSRELVSRFQGSRYFQILETTIDYRTIEEEIDRDRCMLAIVVPLGYSRDLLSGRQAEVQLLFDGSDSNTASIALGYATALAQGLSIDWSRAVQDTRWGTHFQEPLDGRLRVWYNNDLKSRNYLVPGLIALIMMIIAALLTSLTIAREWEMGTMEQLLSTPVRPSEVVLGKMAAFFALGIIDMLITIVVGVFLFRVPMRGSYLFLVGTGCIFLIGALCWGILLSAVTRTQVLAYQLAMLTSFLPAFLLSGFVFDIANMPIPVQAVTYIFPTRYFVTILKGIFLRGVGMKVLVWEAALLGIYGLAVFLLATRKLKQKVA